jgi:lipid II:glycine glycyltransferase (peptidoglycan interpeptide bridge formation enzyme)
LFAAFNRSGDIISFLNLANFANSFWYHTGCSSEEALKSGANYAVMWEAIKDSKTRKCRYFDVGAIFPHATDERQKGLTGFKMKFGGQARPFFRCEMAI